MSADLVASLEGLPTGLEFELDADTDTADRLVLANPNENVFTTILDIDGVTFQISPTGNLQQGDSFQIIDADKINGTPVILSTQPVRLGRSIRSRALSRWAGDSGATSTTTVCSMRATSTSSLVNRPA